MATATATSTGNHMNLKELKQKKISELSAFAKDLKIEAASGMRKSELIFAILQALLHYNHQQRTLQAFDKETSLCRLHLQYFRY